MTHRPAPTAPRRARVSPGTRAARAASVCLLAVPTMLLAHLVTARAIPRPAVVVLVTAAVFAVTTVSRTRSRWRLAVVVGLAQAAGHALLAAAHPVAGPDSTGGCLPVVGRGAELGLQLALLRHDASCPKGGLAVGPSTTAAVAALLTAALILAAHSLIAVLAATLVSAAEVAVATLRSCTRLVRPPLPPVVVPVAAPRQVTAAPTADRPLRPLWTPRPALRRGPPRTATA